ncbi:tRNA pseudouridine(38-40) synthase TruA [Acidaminobacter hydrogenoformans]|uniref:tRNA pseudouridine synthase A n=1 Tax=Acidaminobacter hydrogenoformans DSM 2784 TaxID=1120920 RepID=A0A1G5S6T2_9FIRM|nr:tRNA pseudouridine(38-40) synthase TruA [Acidaminobacter hydrogenoformans]SCZ81918.1 tRNA pseudouridine38-40 synthase [Acidaminobacter hydrogenoformans DSM 2784]
MKPRKPPRRVKLTIAYQGTQYQGWQRQKRFKSIQGTLEKLLSNLLSEKIELTASGRTDAGVHAKAQVASFLHHSSFPTGRLCYVLNYHLPEDIIVIKAEDAALDFHPRYSAQGKIYEYRIDNAPVRDPQKAFQAWHVSDPLNVEAMREAVKYWVGEHDFASFKSQGSSAKTTVRRIDSIEIIHSGAEILLIFRGNGFLYNMVRIMTAVLVMIGKEKLSPEDALRLLEAKDRTLAPWTAPPQGLYLSEVIY